MPHSLYTSVLYGRFPSRSTRPTSNPTIAWSTVEEELVYKGVLAHGVGNWAAIHDDKCGHKG